MNEQTIPISALTLDPELQPRAVMDADLVERYAEALGDGATFPPVSSPTSIIAPAAVLRCSSPDAGLVIC